jgi:hypothetical protein
MAVTFSVMTRFIVNPANWVTQSVAYRLFLSGALDTPRVQFHF